MDEIEFRIEPAVSLGEAHGEERLSRAEAMREEALYGGRTRLANRRVRFDDEPSLPRLKRK